MALRLTFYFSYAENLDRHHNCLHHLQDLLPNLSGPLTFRVSFTFYTLSCSLTILHSIQYSCLRSPLKLCRSYLVAHLTHVCHIGIFQLMISNVLFDLDCYFRHARYLDVQITIIGHGLVFAASYRLPGHPSSRQLGFSRLCLPCGYAFLYLWRSDLFLRPLSEIWSSTSGQIASSYSIEGSLSVCFSFS